MPDASRFVWALRVAGCLLFGAAAVAEIAVHRQEQSERAAIDRWMRDFTIDVRHPEHLRVVNYAISSSEAAELAGDAAVRDALGSVALSELTDEQRALWIESLSHVDEELAGAASFTREAIRRRPGWVNQAYVFGQVEYARARRTATLGERTARWLVPLRAAAESAPVDRQYAIFTANALLEGWDAIDASARRDASSLFALALHDARFAASAYGPISDRIGAAAAARLLPDQPRSIAAAVAAHAEIGDAAWAATLHERWLRVERAARKTDLDRLVQRAALNDVAGLRSGCRAWAQQHPVSEFDDTQGRREAGHLLALWPPERGSWRNDPRSPVVSFFIDRDGDGVEGAVLLATARALADMPLPQLARAEVLGGEAWAAARRAEGADSAGGFEWTAFFVDLARERISRNELDAATEALDGVAPQARNECDVVLARAAIERARGRVVVPDPQTILTDYPAPMWSRNRVAVCIDAGAASRTFDVDLDLAADALVGWGFDGGRSGSVLLRRGPARVTIPLESRTGRHVVAVDNIAGGPVTVIRGTLR